MVNFESIDVSMVVDSGSVGDVKEGIALARNASGEAVLTDGTNRFTGIAYGIPINGIVTVKRWGISKAIGDGTSTYEYDMPLKAGASGELVPWDSANDAADLIVARVEVLPDANNVMEVKLRGGV